MARTDSKWEVGPDGTYIKTQSPNGFNVLINGVNKYLNFNQISGAAGYGIRDNNGVIEFKSAGGAWTSVGSVSTDGVTISGDGTPGNPLRSNLSSYGSLTITGTVNGTNRVFTIPAGVILSSLEIFDGTQYQTQGIDYTASGTTITFAVGHAPSVVLTAFGSTLSTAAGIPVASTVATFQQITITGTQNGTNKVFNLSTTPSIGAPFFFVVNGQIQNTTDYSISGAVLTIASGASAPLSTDILKGYGAVAPVAVSINQAITYFTNTYAQALTLATGTAPFFVIVKVSEQFNSAPTTYFYDGVTTGHLSQIASLLI